MPKKDRSRINYMPRNAALEALGLAYAMFPNLRAQALIDKPAITAVSALAHQHWRPPNLWGRDRDTWKLPRKLGPVSHLRTVKKQTKRQ